MFRKVIFRFVIPSLFIAGIFFFYRYYSLQKEKKRRASYYENIVDTSSPTVEVLRDSIRIPYQNQKRTLHVYVPPTYDLDTTTTFPVIYMLDGESSFNDMENMGPEWQMDEVINLANDQGMQTSIVIGINQAEDRDAEYTPFQNEENPDAHGEEFINWLSSDLKSWVDTHYRTKKDAESTTIGGISRSGMMAYYAVMAHPDVFGNALILSPSMWVDHDRLLAMELTQKELENKKLFISVGQKEGGIMVPHAREVYQKFKAQGLGENQLRFEIIPKEGHWHLAWRKSFAIAYPWLVGK